MRSSFAAALVVAAGCVSEPPHRSAPIDLQAKVEGGRNAQGAVGTLVWGLGGPPAPAEVQDPQGQERNQVEARLRTQFGSSILIGADGQVTKQYFLAGELGNTFLKLITEIVPNQTIAPAPVVPPPGLRVGGAQSHSILGRMLGGREVEVTYVPEFEALAGAAIMDKQVGTTQPIPAVTGAPMPMGEKEASKVALVLVTGEPSALGAFEGALDLFYASIPQVEITVQVIEYSNADALAFGVRGVQVGEALLPTLQNLSSSQLVQSFTSIFPMRQPVVGATPVTDVGLFQLGGIHDSWQLNVILEALEASNLADITSSPKLVVRNGGTASVSMLTQIPFPKAKISQFGSEVATDIEFKPVGVKMNIIPVIAGTDSVLLQVYADVSAVTGFANTDPVVTPITSTRTAVTTVYLKNGHSLVIGGLKSVTTFESETKVPILGDIPLLGFLFRSTSSSRQETSVAFHITPRIVTDRGQATDGIPGP